MDNKYIDFMGLDFNTVAEKKKNFNGFRRGFNFNGDDFTDAFFYFCVIMDFFIDKYGCVSYPAYYKFCVSLDAYLYAHMFASNGFSMETLTGFNPGRLFWHTVDCGNEELFELLVTLYQQEWTADVQV